jgi:hypothetical protein
MMRILSLAALVALLWGPVTAQDGESYTIKLKKPAAGQITTVDSVEQSLEQVKVADNNGNIQQEKDEKKGHDYVYKQTILEVKGDKGTRLKREYQKATATEDGKPKKLSYDGKTVLIEKKGDKYTFRIEGGGEITDDDAKELDKEFNKKGNINETEMVKLMLPPGPIKVGQTWKVDPKVIAKMLQEEAMMELNAEKTTGTGKLLKAYRKDRRQFGVLSIKMNIVPKSVTKDGMTIAFQPNSKVVLDMTVDGCIDGSSSTHSVTYTGDFFIEALLPSADMPMFKLNVTGKGKGTEKTVEQ